MNDNIEKLKNQILSFSIPYHSKNFKFKETESIIYAKIYDTDLLKVRKEDGYIYYNNTDFKFKSTKKYQNYIELWLRTNKLTVTVYEIIEETEFTVDLVEAFRN